MDYRANLVKQLTARTGVYVVTHWAHDANLGPCMTFVAEVISDTADHAVAHALAKVDA